MRLLAALILAASFLGGPTRASAEIELPAEVLKHLENDKHYSAWKAMPVEKYWDPYPGMAFNVAYYFDKRGSGELLAPSSWAELTGDYRRTDKVSARIYDPLAAAHWYHVFLAAAPKSDLAPLVRARIPVILEESNAKIFAWINLIENVFREVNKVFAEIHKRPESWRKPGFAEAVKDGEEKLAKAVAGLAAARIHLGDVDGGLALLREFSLEHRHSKDDVLASLILQGRDSEARPFGTASDFAEYKKIFTDVREAFTSTCSSHKQKRSYIKLAAEIGMEDTYSVTNLNLMTTRIIDDERTVAGTDYESFVLPIKRLSFRRNIYDLFQEICGAKGG
ncbi:hypothetical protein ACFL2T_03705 [Elusimicrobiota bacterium]